MTSGEMLVYGIGLFLVFYVAILKTIQIFFLENGR